MTCTPVTQASRNTRLLLRQTETHACVQANRNTRLLSRQAEIHACYPGKQNTRLFPRHTETHACYPGKQNTRLFPRRAEIHACFPGKQNTRLFSRQAFPSLHVHVQPGLGIRGCSVHLRPPLQAEPLWHEDVLHCYITCSAVVDNIRPSQPDDDMSVLLPLLGVCTFVRFEPHRFEFVSSPATSTSSSTASSRSKWVHRDCPDMGMIVELTQHKWEHSNRPIRLLIDIRNINTVFERDSHWRSDILQFTLFHYLHLAQSKPDTIPSLICQVPHCPHSTYHFSSNQPSYGICVDHLNQLIDRKDKAMSTHPMPFILQHSINQILAAPTSATSTSSPPPTSYVSRRCDRCLFFQLVSGMLGSDHGFALAIDQVI
jgi:hypothetical protein